MRNQRARRQLGRIRTLTMQILSWSLKLFITSNNVDLESKNSKLESCRSR